MGVVGNFTSMTEMSRHIYSVEPPGIVPSRGVNVHATENCTVKNVTTSGYDGEGAMKFTVAVVLVYGVAVIGVFVMGYYGRKRHASEEVDRQANYFLKTFDQIRWRLQKEKDVGTMNTFLSDRKLNENFDYNGKQYSCDGLSNVSKNIFAYMALPIIMTQQTTSDSGIDSECMASSPRTEGELEDGEKRVQNSTKSVFDPKLEIVEELSDEDLDDNVFMTDEERKKYGVDLYVDIKETDIC